MINIGILFEDYESYYSDLFEVLSQYGLSPFFVTSSNNSDILQKIQKPKVFYSAISPELVKHLLDNKINIILNCLTESNGASRCIPQKNEEVDTFNSLLKNTSNKLETMNDSSKSKLIVNHLKTIYNKLQTSNKNQFKNEVELLEMLYL